MSKDPFATIQSLPFTTRSAWINIQTECPDLRRVHAHLKQGTRPSRKLTNIRDVKRYLNVATIAKDGLLVVRRSIPLHSSTDLIIVPRSVLDGLVTAIHIRLDHPTKHQMLVLMKRNFYALDISASIERVCDSCHMCSSLRKFPKAYTEQTSEPPPNAIGVSFAADVIKRSRQLIFVLRESVTAFTGALIIADEKSETLRDALLRLCMEMHPLDGPHAVVRVDPAPGFMAMREDELLQLYRINIEIGRVKNPNKNPVAEKAVAELEDELLKQEPGGGPVSPLTLSIAVARLNSRIRSSGLFARELYTQRNQFTHEQLPFVDEDIIQHIADRRNSNHVSSALSKSGTKGPHSQTFISVGDLIYLQADRDKTKARPRYVVVSIVDDWCYVKKFVGRQLRANSYKVKVNECYRIPPELSVTVNPSKSEDYDTEDIELNTDNVVYDPVPHTPVTEQCSTPVPTVLSAPFEQFSSSPDVLEDSESDGDQTVEADVQANSRPQRNRKLPSYLKDYVVY